MFLCIFYFIKSFYDFDLNPAPETVLLTFFGLFLWFSFDVFLNNEHISPSYTDHHFILYALHPNVGAIFAKLLYYILPKSEFFGYVNFILSTLLMLITTEALCYITNYISPKLFKVLSGNR